MPLYTLDIADDVKDLIKTNHGSLKVVAIGDLGMLPSPDEIDNWLPCCIIRANSAPGEIAHPLKRRYLFSIFHIRKYSPEEDIQRKKIEEAHALAETLESQTWMGKQYTKGMINNFFISNIDFNPDEEALFNLIADVTISRIDVEFFVKGER